MPSPCSACSHAISVKAFRWRIWEKELARTTWPETHEPRGIMRPIDKATADSLSVQSFDIIKNTGHGNFVIGRNQTRARNGLSVWDWPVYSHPLPPPPHTPLFRYFFWEAWEEGAAVHRLSETDNTSSNCPSKLTDKVRRIVRSKWTPFPFQIKTYYLSHANYQTDNPSHSNNPSLVWKRPFLL